jgi:hypothetical protein
VDVLGGCGSRFFGCFGGVLVASRWFLLAMVVILVMLVLVLWVLCVLWVLWVLWVLVPWLRSGFAA